VAAETASPDRAADDLLPRRGGRRGRWVALTAAVVAVIAFTVVAWNRFGSDPSLVRSPLIGKPAPEFTLPGLDGGMVRSADFAGRAYVVNFWASWCVPCREEAEHLESFSRRWAAEGVGIVGIVYNDTASEARQFRDEFDLTYPEALDPDGTAAIDFGVFGVPETYVIDRRGVVMAKLIGGVGPTTLDEVLAQVLAGETFTSQNDRYRTSPDDS